MYKIDGGVRNFNPLFSVLSPAKSNMEQKFAIPARCIGGAARYIFPMPERNGGIYEKIYVVVFDAVGGLERGGGGIDPRR